MTNDATDGLEAFIIPARTLQGSRREMLDDIDQAIVGLLALRHLIDDKAPPPDRLADTRPRNHRQQSRWSHLLAAVLPGGSAW
jgi:hypothetical protein